MEVWVFAPIIYGLDDGILCREKIAKRSVSKDLSYFRDLSAEQAALIGQQATFNQTTSRWEVRATVHVTGWFYSSQAGWISTGKRKVFHHDALPVEGVPARQVIASALGRAQRTDREVLTDSLHKISSALTKIASGSFGPSELPELTAQVG